MENANGALAVKNEAITVKARTLAERRVGKQVGDKEERKEKGKQIIASGKIYNDVVRVT